MRLSKNNISMFLPGSMPDNLRNTHSNHQANKTSEISQNVTNFSYKNSICGHQEITVQETNF